MPAHGSVETKECTTWTGVGHEIWVICGPVYNAGLNEPIQPKTRYGAKQVSVPDYCFKIVFSKGADGKVRSLAFIVPQENAAGHNPSTFLKSIREMERRTGLNFLSTLPQTQQDEIEKEPATTAWNCFLPLVGAH